MASRHDCTDPQDLLAGMRLARTALGKGELVVVPTDTVYGVAADAFSSPAVQRLLDAKGRTRQSPPPVLIPGPATLDALAFDIAQQVRDLIDEFWPGGLTVILRAQPSLDWDLGETRGTVALRMPDSRIALELLQEVGPLAVSSANATGQPAAMDVDAAQAMLGDSVSVYLDGGRLPAHEGSADSTGSTIVDATGLSTGGGLRIVRHGVIPDAEIERVVGTDLVQ
jgi:tRNA threonylcarbamoyl adenosine modification protein (Sua5/YciO/YrdC/YwlC family)